MLTDWVRSLVSSERLRSVSPPSIRELIDPEAVMRRCSERVVTSISSRRRSLPSWPRITAVASAVPLNSLPPRSVSRGKNMLTDWVRSSVFNETLRFVFPPSIRSLTFPLTLPVTAPSVRSSEASRSSPLSFNGPFTSRVSRSSLRLPFSFTSPFSFTWPSSAPDGNVKVKRSRYRSWCNRGSRPANTSRAS